MDARTQGVDKTADAPAVTAPPNKRGFFSLSPINQRRWYNFKRNKRGYWSFWIFVVLFFVSLFAEVIANDKPFLIKHDGQLFFPAIVTYPETAFGGEFETAADYRDPYLQKLIKEKGGSIFWPLIRYSYDTHNLDLPTPAPSPPTWRLTEEQCKPLVEKKGLTGCRDLEYNWLGTDDQGRDVVARLIYGFRISVLFGLILTIVSSVIGVAAEIALHRAGGDADNGRYDGQDQPEQNRDAEAVDQPRHHVAALIVGAKPVVFEVAAARQALFLDQRLALLLGQPPRRRRRRRRRQIEIVRVVGVTDQRPEDRAALFLDQLLQIRIAIVRRSLELAAEGGFRIGHDGGEKQPTVVFDQERLVVGDHLGEQ